MTFSEVFFILPNLHKTADPMLTLLPSQVQTTPILFLVTCNSHSNLFLLHWWYSLSVLPLVLNFHTSALWTSLFLFFTLKNVRTTQTLNPIQQRRLGFAYIFFTPSLFSNRCSPFALVMSYVLCTLSFFYVATHFTRFLLLLAPTQHNNYKRQQFLSQKSKDYQRDKTYDSLKTFFFKIQESYNLNTKYHLQLELHQSRQWQTWKVKVF